MNTPPLIGKQTEILYIPDHKNIIVTGSAGSGKSLLAIYRAYWLAKAYPSEKILLLTYNNPINKDISQRLKSLARQRNERFPTNLTINTYYSFCKQYLKDVGSNKAINTNHIKTYLNKNGDALPANTQKYKEADIQAALKNVSKKYPYESTFNRPVSIFYDEITWIQDMAISSLEEYVESVRIGRQGTRIERKNRKYFFEIYQEYLRIRSMKSSPRYYDFADIGHVVRHIVNKLDTKYDVQLQAEYKYNYILIDEFQDFSLGMLQTIASVLDKKGSYTLLGDSAQGVFGRRIPWKNTGFTNYKKYELNRNYRNSKEISELAEMIADTKYFDKNNEFYVRSLNSTRPGTYPLVRQFVSETEEVEWIIKALKQIPKTYTACVIVPENRANSLKYAFRRHDINIKYVTDNFNEDKSNLSYSTYNTVKGLEFDIVILGFLGSRVLTELLKRRNPEATSLSEVREDLEMYSTHLYVGVTRAKHGLFISYSGSVSPLFPIKYIEKYPEGGLK